jgi:hypothetical protein
MKREYTHAFTTQPMWHVENKRQRPFDSLPPLSSLISDVPSVVPLHTPAMYTPYSQPLHSYEEIHFVPEAYKPRNPSHYPVTHGSAEPIHHQPTPSMRQTTPSPPVVLSTPKPTSPPASPPQKSESPQPNKLQKKRPRKSSPTSTSSDEEDLATTLKLNPIPTVENPRFDFHQLQPIRILAYQFVLSADPNKRYRYRDIKRALFEKCAKEHVDMVNTDSDHSLLHQRLPHKLSLSQFCKRVILLVFHHIVRDGREPRFWRQK